YHVPEAELRGRFGDSSGLGGIERAGQAGLDVAEGARARAGVAHQHEGRVLLVPALADIGTPRLLADGMQAVRAHDRTRLAIAFRHRRLDPDPIGLFQRRCVRPMRLLGMARAAAGVENDGHGSSGTYLRMRASRRKPHAAQMWRRIAWQRCAIRRRASPFGSDAARPNTGELSRLPAAKMSCRRRHADVMNVGWLVSATGAIFAGRGSGIDGGIHAGENGQDDAFSWVDCLDRWYRHGRRLACRRAA